MTLNKIYFPGLNGLRAIAAISVLIGHITSTTFINHNFGLLPIRLGEHGVTLFFVISGFLITFLLLKEKEKTDTIEIKNFYLRRILRIWPIYYLIMIIGFILAFFINDIVDIQSKNLLWYIFLTANLALVFNESVRIIIHYWSIGVEEQFYLIWPWFIKIKQKRLLLNIIIIVCLFFAIKSALWLFIGNKFIVYKIMNITRIHCMLIGAIGAILHNRKNTYLIKISGDKTIQIIVWILFIIVFLGIFEIPVPIISEIVSVLSLFLIFGQINESKRVVNLEIKVLDFIGRISYGIYVIHPMIIISFSFIYKNLELPNLFQILIVYSSIIFSTILIAHISSLVSTKKN